MAVKMPKDVRDKVKWLTDMVSERDRELEEMEKRLEASFEATKRADDLLLEEKIVWKDEKHELKVQIAHTSGLP